MDSASDNPASLQHSVETLREDVSAVQNMLTKLLTRFSASTAPRKCDVGYSWVLAQLPILIYIHTGDYKTCSCETYTSG